MFEQLGRELGVNIEYYENISSTNDIASHPDCQPGTFIVAEYQSAGRGQRGNRWNSSAGKNLTFSLLLCPEFLRAEHQFYISKIISLAICDVLSSFGLTPKIKWPNDIYVGDKKITGILIENDITGKNISRSIIGVGLNVNQTEFSSDLPNPTSLAIETGLELKREEVLRRIIISVSKRYEELLKSHYSTLDDDYMHILYRLNEPHYYYDALEGRKILGIIRDVKPSGELAVEHLPEESRMDREETETSECSDNISDSDKNKRTVFLSDGPNIHYYLFKEIEFLISF